MTVDQKTRTATILAVLMHLAGLILILIGANKVFETLTPFNLVVMFFLVIYTAPGDKNKFLLFLFIAILAGFFSEMIGVQTGLLFGNYTYDHIMGPKWNGVPFLIGLNWFIVVYASGMVATKINLMLADFLPVRAAYSRWFGFSLILDGALLATLFDWIMEPAAIHLGFWTWDDGHIPLLNYLSWFLISLLLLTLFRTLKLKYHPFATNLLLIQALFFLLIR